MLADDRLNAIVRMVTEAGSMSVADLAEALDVTASTIRRDLQTLDRAHRLAKVHGGATSLERAHIARDLTIPERSELHVDDKRAIVQAAACLIEPGFVRLHRFGVDDAATRIMRPRRCRRRLRHEFGRTCPPLDGAGMPA